MAPESHRHSGSRALLLALTSIVALGLLLSRCPANRDGMPGQLAQAMEETTVAARSAVLALDLRVHDRSTAQLAAVQISDARDEVVKSYQDVADLEAEDPADVNRQRMLTEAMTRILGELNTASAALHDVTGQPRLQVIRNDLAAAATALQTEYR